MRFLVAVVASCAAVNCASAMDIKGVSIGMSRADVMGRFPKLFCNTPRPSVEVCGDFRSDPTARHPRAFAHDELKTYAGEKVNGFFVHMAAGRVTGVSVRLSGSSYLPVKTTLAEKFGQAASTEHSTIQNRMGAKFDQEEVTWRDGDQRLVAKRRGSNLTEMEVALRSEAADAAQAETLKERAKGATNDL